MKSKRPVININKNFTQNLNNLVTNNLLKGFQFKVVWKRLYKYIMLWAFFDTFANACKSLNYFWFVTRRRLDLEKANDDIQWFYS